MSDHLVEIARGSHGEVCYANETMKEPRLLQHVLADEITRLRAELATAQEYRGAINDALTDWLNPILDDETPKDALRRLIQYEITAALDPAVSQAAADLVATARRDGMEEAAKIAEECYRQNGPLSQRGFPERYRAGLAASAQTIAAAIRAAAGEVKP